MLSVRGSSLIFCPFVITKLERMLTKLGKGTHFMSTRVDGTISKHKRI